MRKRQSSDMFVLSDVSGTVGMMVVNASIAAAGCGAKAPVGIPGKLVELVSIELLQHQRHCRYNCCNVSGMVGIIAAKLGLLWV